MLFVMCAEIFCVFLIQSGLFGKNYSLLASLKWSVWMNTVLGFGTFLCFLLRTAVRAPSTLGPPRVLCFFYLMRYYVTRKEVPWWVKIVKWVYFSLYSALLSGQEVVCQKNRHFCTTAIHKVQSDTELYKTKNATQPPKMKNSLCCKH